MLLSATQTKLIAALQGEDKATALSTVDEVENLEFFVDGYMPLHLACQKPWPEVVEAILVRTKDSSHYKTMTGKTALHLAQAHNQLAVAESLVRHNPTLRTLGDRQGRTPLHEAAREGKTAFLKCYLEHGFCDVNVKDNQQRRPLHDAVIGLHLEEARLLLNNGANPHVYDNSANTPQSYLSLSLALSHAEETTLKLQQLLALLSSHSLPSLFSLTACSADMSSGLPDIVHEQATQAITFARDNLREATASQEEVKRAREKAIQEIKDNASLQALEVRFASLGFKHV